MARGNRARGIRAEQEACSLLKELWWCRKAHRSQQGDGAHDPDILGGPENIWVEVKARARFAAEKFVDQAQRDATDGSVPVVLLRRDGAGKRPARWFLIMEMQDAEGFALRMVDHFDASTPPVHAP